MVNVLMQILELLENVRENTVAKQGKGQSGLKIATFRELTTIYSGSFIERP